MFIIVSACTNLLPESSDDIIVTFHSILLVLDKDL